MPSVQFVEGVRDDVDRILDLLTGQGVQDAAGRVREIIEAISVLAQSPFIGRPARGDLRELVIGRRTRGYVALYRYIPEIDTVFVLGLRSQREAGYRS